MVKRLLAATAFAAFSLPILAAHAAGPYDGRWVVDFPAVNTNLSTGANPGCASLRLVIDIKDNQLNASLARSVTAAGGGQIVQNATGPGARPVIGSVKADGTVSATWENFPATGKLSGDQGEILVKGECGPRLGKAVRVPKE